VPDSRPLSVTAHGLGCVWSVIDRSLESCPCPLEIVRLGAFHARPRFRHSAARWPRLSLASRGLRTGDPAARRHDRGRKRSSEPRRAPVQRIAGPGARRACRRCLRNRRPGTRSGGRPQFRVQPEPAGIRAERPAAVPHRRRGAEHAALRDQLDHRHRRTSGPCHGHRARRPKRISARPCMSTASARATIMSCRVFGPSTTRDSVGLIVDFAMNPLRHVVDPPEIGYLAGARVAGAFGDAPATSRHDRRRALQFRGQLHRAPVAVPPEPQVRAARRRGGRVRTGRRRRLRSRIRRTMHITIRMTDPYFDPYSQ
jgi:hypothetical protein